jgi:hypothetical protein
MKKILILMLVLAVALSAMVSCDKLADLGIDLDAILGKDTPDQGETPDDQPDTPAADADLQGAYDYVHQLTKTIAEKTGADYTLVGSVLIGDKNFTVNWTVTDSRVVLTTTEDGKTVTVTVPEPTEDIPYDLTFTIYNEKGESLSKTYKHVVPKFAYTSFAEYAAAAKGDAVVVTGIVTGVISKTTGSNAYGLYIQDLNNEGGYYVWNLTDDPHGVIEVGMTVKVKGNKDLYNGTYEVVSPIVEIVDSTIKAVEPVDFTELYLGATALNDNALVGKQGMLVTVKGVTILEAGDNGYYYFQLGELKTYLRISSSNNPTTKEALENVKSVHGANYGNIADVTGVISIYNGNFYLSPVSADAFSNIQIPERTDAEKVQMELDLLKLDSKVTADKVITLLANGTNYSEVVFAWACESEHAVLADGKLTITVPDDKATITVTVTATCGEVTETKSFEITLSKEIISLEEAIAIGSAKEHNTYTEEKYLIAGVITEVYNDQYGNMYITDAAGNVFTVYGTYSADGSTKYGAMETKPVAGDYVVVLGVLGQYNGTAQTKNAWIQSWVSPTSVEDALAIGGAKEHNTYTEEKYLVTGVITEVSNTTYGNLYIKDEAGNTILVYGTYDATGANRYDKMTYKPVAGDTITVLGTLGSYNGTAQFKNAWIVACEKGAAEHEHNFVDGKCECGEEDPNYVPPTVDPELDEIVFDFGDKGDAAHNDGVEITSGTKTYTSNGYQLVLTGVSKVYGDAFDKNGNSILKFGTSSAVGTITFEVPANVTSVIIKVAPYKFYNDNNIVDVNGTTYTLGTDGYTDITVDTTTTKTITIASSKSAAKPRCMIDAIVFVLGEGSNTPVDPQPPVHEHNFVEGKCECGESDPNYVPPVVDPEVPTFGVVTPVAGTAYKFGMVQSNAGKTVYLKGGMSGYYMATTEDADAAIDVYLEETAGGYYLYTLNADGSKLYINMVVSGTHVNGAYEATATTVYTYDEARKSIVATVNGELYHFGTRNDNTYLTVGPCKVSYGGFDCQFYGATGSAPVDPQPPVHEHNFVEGKCECGEEDPNYVPPVVDPETPEVGAPAGSADFDTITLPSSKPNGDSSYTGSYTTASGWTIANSAIQCGGAADVNPQFVVIGSSNESKAPCLNGKVSAPGTLTSPTLTGGVSKITIDYTKMFTDTKLGFTVKVTDLATGEVYTKSVSVELPKNEKYQVYSFEFVLDTPITGDFTIEVVNDCPSANTGNKDRVTILDLSWYA